MARIKEKEIQELKKLLDQSTFDGDERRIEMYRTMLNAEMISQQEAERMLFGKWETDVSENKKKQVPHKIAPSDAYHNANDKSKCAHCWGTQVTLIGDLIVDGSPRPIYHCTGCNKVYSDVPSYIKMLMDTAKTEGAESVGFKAEASGSGGGGTPYVQNDYQVQQTNNKLDTTNSSLSMIQNAIFTLTQKIEQLANQNHMLMDQLAKDPLISIRKAVVEFDLK